jgi:hypothetical protein
MRPVPGSRARRRRSAASVVGLVAVLAVAGCAPRDGAPTAGVAGRATSAAPAPSASAGASPVDQLLHVDGTYDVLLVSFEPAGPTAVVEPAARVSGAQFCRSHHLPATDSRCNRAEVIDESHVKITVPVDPDLRATETRHGDPGCVSSTTGAGSCAMDTAQFAQWRRDHPNGLVRITMEHGSMTRLAEAYQP